VVLAHNHPSGDPEPSVQRILAIATGRLLGVSVVDHLSIGAGRHVSLRERGAVT
jgi:DNA repair protein RadC